MTNQKGTMVVKFGGTTLATAVRIEKVAEFVRSDPRRTLIVVSAPGKRPGRSDDEKVTDMLFRCAASLQQGGNWEAGLDEVRERFAEIIEGLEVDRAGFWEVFSAMEEQIAALSVNDLFSRDFIVSRGEYLMGIIMSEVLKLPFHNPAEFVTFNNNRELNDLLTNDRIAVRFAADPRGVVPGFYGSILSYPEKICTFPRGGSDITGATLARGVQALRYENCTDVPGMLAADPRIVKNPVTMGRLTYPEAGGLCLMGASVLHHDVLYPLEGTGIPTRVLNALDGNGRPFTEIRDDPPPRTGIIVGLAGRQGFTALTIGKSRMHTRKGSALQLLAILLELDISFEHIVTEFNTLSLIFDQAQLVGGKAARLESGIASKFLGATLTWQTCVTSIAVVGEGMKHHVGAAAKIFTSLADENINIVFISQIASEFVIVLGVADADYERAIQAIYTSCVEKDSLRRDIPVRV